jgi:2-amino-4-hydroxy-6-hydroxymethyldihydropteridine diphosphokinase
VRLVYLGLGSNLGEREGHLQAALDALQGPWVKLLRVSSVYESAPMEVRSQPWFLNAVAEAECDCFPLQLLSRTAGVETALGRKRTVPKGPRTIDIDILLFGAFVIRTARLEVPHPRLTERRFVLEPLAELAPDLRHPVSRRTAREMLGGVASQTVRKTAIALRVPV